MIKKNEQKATFLTICIAQANTFYKCIIVKYSGRNVLISPPITSRFIYIETQWCHIAAPPWGLWMTKWCA